MLAGKLQYEDIVQLLMTYFKEPQKAIVNDYRPDLIWTAMQSGLKSKKTESDTLSKPDIKTEKKEEQPKDADSVLISEVNKLKKYIRALKKPKTEFTIFDVDEYKHENTPNNGKIGDGAQSNVYKVYQDERKYYAKKEFNSQTFTQKDIQRFLQESEILFILRHPCIVKVYGFNYGDETNSASMILSFEKNSLEDSINNKSLTNEEKSRIAVEIVLGMRFVHSKNFIHRDLKPSNILLSKNGHVRISDFGLAKDDSLKESMTKGIGTIRFMAPELLRDEDGELSYNNSVDVYAFGIILFFIVIGSYPPFNLMKIAKGEMPKMPDSMAKWVRDLINNCFCFNPDERPSFQEVFEIMKSNNFDLFADVDGGKLTQKKKTQLKIIEDRIAKIEAFEFQYQDD